MNPLQFLFTIPGLWLVRVCVGLAAVVTAVALHVWTRTELSLVLATGVLGVVILAATGIEYAWVAPYVDWNWKWPWQWRWKWPWQWRWRLSPATPTTPRDNEDEIFRDAARVALTTQGVVLALFALSGFTLTTTLVAGATSLGFGVCVASMLYFLVAFGIPDSRRRVAAAYLFNLTFWALAYGLICIIAWMYTRI